MVRHRFRNNDCFFPRQVLLLTAPEQQSTRGTFNNIINGDFMAENNNYQLRISPSRNMHLGQI